jgi:hypothetical protein
MVVLDIGTTANLHPFYFIIFRNADTLGKLKDVLGTGDIVNVIAIVDEVPGLCFKALEKKVSMKKFR